MMKDYLEKHISITYESVRRFIKCLLDGGIIMPDKGNLEKKSGKYIFTELLDITDSFDRFINQI